MKTNLIFQNVIPDTHGVGAKGGCLRREQLGHRGLLGVVLSSVTGCRRLPRK